MDRGVNIRTLGYVAQTKRTIVDGSAFDYLFPKSTGSITVVNSNGNVKDILHAMQSIVKRTLKQTQSLATYLNNRSRNTEDLLRNLFNFIYTHIDYREDPAGYQDLREPARMWADKYGVCASYSIFISSVLTNLGIKHDFKVVALNGAMSYHHVYVVVPKNQKAVNRWLKPTDIPRKDYWVVDPVLDSFDAEAPKITKQQQVVGLSGVEVRVLGGTDYTGGNKTPISGAFKDDGHLMGGLSGYVDYNNGNVVEFSVQKISVGTPTYNISKKQWVNPPSLGLGIKVYGPTDSIKLSRIKPGNFINITNCPIAAYNKTYKVAFLGNDTGGEKDTMITVYADLGVSGANVMGMYLKPRIETAVAQWHLLTSDVLNFVTPAIGYSDKPIDPTINPYKTILNNTFNKIPGAQNVGLKGLGSLGASAPISQFAPSVETMLKNLSKEQLKAAIADLKTEVNQAPKHAKDVLANINDSDIKSALSYGAGASASAGAAIVAVNTAAVSAGGSALIGAAASSAILAAAGIVASTAVICGVVYMILPDAGQKAVKEGLSNFVNWVTNAPDPVFYWNNLMGFERKNIGVNEYGKLVRAWLMQTTGSISGNDRIQGPNDYLPILKSIYKNAPIANGEQLVPNDDMVSLLASFEASGKVVSANEFWKTPNWMKYRAFCCTPYLAEIVYNIPFQTGLSEAVGFFSRNNANKLNVQAIQDRYKYELENSAKMMILLTKKQADDWDIANGLTKKPQTAGGGTVSMVVGGLLLGGLILGNMGGKKSN